MAAAWKLRRVVHNVRHVLAIELMCAAQGLDYRKPLRPGVGVAQALRAVRALVAPLEGDRVLSTDIGVLADAVGAGKFDEVIAAYAGPAGLAGSGAAVPRHGSTHRGPS
jgi:histidine ammonia-lyase